MSGQTRTPVLILLYADGWVEAYADRCVDIHIAIVPHLTTRAGERMADEWIDLTLPRRYAGLHYPSGLRAAQMIQTVRPSDIARRNLELALVRECRAIRDATTEDTIWTI